MSKEFISFHPHSINISRFFLRDVRKIKNIAFQLEEHNIDYEEFFLNFSKQKSFLVCWNKNKDTLEIYTEQGGIRCGYFKEKTDLHGITFIPYTFQVQNKVMKYGVCVQVEHVLFRSVFETGAASYYVDGKYYNDYDESSYNSQNDIIWKELEKFSLEKEDENVEIENSKGLEELLELAQNYSELEFNLEQSHVNEVGNVYYFSIEAAEYDRVDRSMYEVHIPLDFKEDFVKGISIEVYKKDNSSEIGEIQEVELRDSECILFVLFNKQIDMSEFAKSGYIRLSSSTVNKDVQQQAIKKIQTRKGNCQYLDHLIGEKRSLGFENIDLSILEKEQRQKKYPPNPSQLKAIEDGIRVKDAYLVLGPPGTGKTTVISEWVKYFVETEKKRVLVSSQNNKAVDNVLERLGENGNINTIRIGSESKIQDNVKQYMYENKMSQLREKIIETSSNNIEIIQNEWVQWYSFKRILENHVQRFKNLHEMQIRMNQRMQEKIRPMYLYLVQCKNRFDEIQKELNEWNEKFIEAEEYAVEAQSFSTLKGLFYTAKTLKIAQIREKSIEQFSNLKKEEGQIKEQYKQQYCQFFNLVSKEEKSDFYAFKNLHNSFIKDSKIIGGLMPSADSFEFFKECIDFHEWGSFEQTKLLLQKLNRALDNCRSVSGVLDEWQCMIADKQNYALGQITIDSVDLVGATCIGINSQKRFSSLDFDVTIIDEAGQIQVHNALVPMSMSNKVIMLGDYQQIPPMVDQDLRDLCERNEVDTKYLESSLFEVLYKEYMPQTNKILLNEQFRMPAEIADLISDQFYEGKYKSFIGKRNMKSLFPSISSCPFVFVDTSNEKNRFETSNPGTGAFNSLESELINKLLKKIHSINPEMNLEENVGVISPYKLQAKTICEGLHSFIVKPEEMVATVDSFQGQERDVIIYSFVRSNKKDPNQKRIGFSNEIRRVNVAMSRCKKMLILVGDYNFLKSCKNESEIEFSKFVERIGIGLQQGKGEFVSCKEMMERLEGD